MLVLEDKTALVTGGGSGIGRAIARCFHREGAKVYVNDVDSDAAAETLGTRYTLIADVSNSAQVSKMFSSLDTIDILVNNAGIAETPKRWREINAKAEAHMSENVISTHWDVTMNLEDPGWQQMLSVHLDGTFYCTREALKLMSQHNSGAIVNIASTAGIAGLADAPHYAAAKAGILGFTKSVAREVASRNIRVNAIAPGYVDTAMTQFIADSVRNNSYRSIPMGRWGTPEEIAKAALFLASEKSSYITGQCLSPNGGAL